MRDINLSLKAETYQEDLLEFTGKTFQEWQEERLKWRNI